LQLAIEEFMDEIGLNRGVKGWSLIDILFSIWLLEANIIIIEKYSVSYAGQN